MIAIVKGGPDMPDDGPREEALTFFSQVPDHFIKWTPQKTLAITVATPAETLQYFHNELDSAKTFAPALTKGKPIDSKIDIVDDTAYLVFSGEGAANMALALRDELSKNFVGSASIPEGRKK